MLIAIGYTGYNRYLTGSHYVWTHTHTRYTYSTASHRLCVRQQMSYQMDDAVGEDVSEDPDRPYPFTWYELMSFKEIMHKRYDVPRYRGRIDHTGVEIQYPYYMIDSTMVKARTTADFMCSCATFYRRDSIWYRGNPH